MRPEDAENSLVRRGQPSVAPPPARIYTASGWEESERDPIWLTKLAMVLWRHKLSFAGVTALGLMLGAAATVAKDPVYRARTSLQLEGFNEAFLGDVTPISPQLANATAESYVRNQLNVLNSDALAERVADKLGVEPPKASSQEPAAARWLPGLLPPNRPSEDQQRILQIRQALTVRVIPQSHTIEVGYDSADPDAAAVGANTVASEFIALNREGRWQLVQDTTEWLGKQTVDLKAKLEKDSRQLQEYARSAGLAFGGSQQTLENERMRQLQDALGRAEADQAAKQSRYEAALSSPTESLPDLVMSGPLQQYITDLQRLRQQLAELKSVYTPAHFRVSRVEAQIAQLESAVESERRATIERLRTDYDAAMRLERLLATANARQWNELYAKSEKEAHFNVLKREVDSTQQLYEAMLQRTKEAGVASALRATNIRVIDPARPPSRPYSPNAPLNLAAGLAFGLIGGIGVAFLRERSNVIKQPGDTVAFNLPQLGVIPSARDDRGLTRPKRNSISLRQNDSEVGLVTWRNDGSLLSESYRSALASILFNSGLYDSSTPGDTRRAGVFVVSSTDAMEGKTTVVANLGIALAQTGRRVLLVDGDLRRPALHRVFDMANDDRGLTDFLRSPAGAGNGSVGNFAQPTSIPGLWLLPSGQDRNAIPRLLYAANLKTLIDSLRAEFDLVLIDSPPMTLFTDARILGRLSDGVVLVVRANRATTDGLRATCLQLMQDGVPVLGTILNDWRLDGSQFRKYGDYHRRYGPAAQA